MSSKNSIHHISPIDGRYSSKTESLSIFFSEFALIQTRVEVEIEYLIQLASLNLKGFKKFQDAEAASLRSIIEHFSESDALEVKDIESTTNHDVKAVEYFIKQRADSIGVNFNTEFIHFGLTSQDINNTAFPLMLKRYLEQNYLPNIKEIIHTLNAKSNEWKEVTLLAKTHGQPASPTTLGKEIKVFADRLEKQCRLLENVEHGGKFGGATGNFNAHKVAYPEVNWVEFGNQFLASLGLTRQQYTTQIEHYDGMAHILDTTKRIHTILIDLARDIWSYVSYEVFTQKINKNETGSSAMPHKVNPIDFENAEGNLMFANAILEFLSSKLPISRLQVTNNQLMATIAPADYRDTSSQYFNRATNELKSTLDRILPIIMFSGLLVVFIIGIIMINQMMTKSQESINEKLGETIQMQKDMPDLQARAMIKVLRETGVITVSGVPVSSSNAP
jgi:adenylosuccinate lyase